jgi:hypothetical protein
LAPLVDLAEAAFPLQIKNAFTAVFITGGIPKDIDLASAATLAHIFGLQTKKC